MARMRAPLTCECDVPDCEGVPIAHLCADHAPQHEPEPACAECGQPRSAHHLGWDDGGFPTVHPYDAKSAAKG